LREASKTYEKQLAMVQDKFGEVNQELEKTKGELGKTTTNLARAENQKQELEGKLSNVEQEHNQKVAQLQAEFDDQAAKDRAKFQNQLARQNLSAAAKAKQ
jgi:hypothetical protein